MAISRTAARICSSIGGSARSLQGFPGSIDTLSSSPKGLARSGGAPNMSAYASRMADVRDVSTRSRSDFGRAFPAGRLVRFRGRRFFFVDPGFGRPESSVMLLLREIDLKNPSIQVNVSPHGSQIESTFW